MCQVNLIIFDIISGETFTLGTTDVAISGVNITVGARINRRGHYSIMINASNVAGSSTTEIEISKMF